MPLCNSLPLLPFNPDMESLYCGTISLLLSNICSCTDGFGQSCLAVVLLAMFLDSDLPPMVAMEIVQGARGPAAIQTIKVREIHSMSVVALCTLRVGLTC